MSIRYNLLIDWFNDRRVTYTDGLIEKLQLLILSKILVLGHVRFCLVLFHHQFVFFLHLGADVRLQVLLSLV